MIVDIHLENNYFPWKKTIENNLQCYLKGHIFNNNQILQGSDIISLFSSLLYDTRDSNNSLKDLLIRFNGSFALVIETPDKLLCVTDRIRSIPLFYSKTEAGMIISDNANYLRDQIITSFNETNQAEFLATGYVTGSDTLFNGIQQIQAGDYLIYSKSDGKCSLYHYFQYLHGNYSHETEEQLLKHLDDVMMGVFNRLIDTTIKQGKTIVVPLSGGLDSRLIVAMLKRLGVEDVICFSYGRKGNKEAEISKKVAETLRYQWFFVEYSNKRWYDCYHSEDMKAFERYAGNLISSPHLQDFIAVKILKEEGKIPDNAVFVPGHTGDMISGGHIPQDIDKLLPNNDQFIHQTIQTHYSLWRWNGKGGSDLKSIFQARIRKSVGDIVVNDAESLANALEYFDFKERQAKFIVNAVRDYEFFGYEWRIPLWDAELMDYFLQIPVSLRLQKALYINYCLIKVFKINLASLSQISCTSIKEKSLFNFIKNHVFQRYPLCRSIAKKIDLKYSSVTAYSSHHLNYYAIMSKKEYLKYSGYGTLNTYVSQNYIKKLREIL